MIAATLGGPLRTRLLDSVHHGPGFQVPSDGPKHPLVGHSSRHPCHQNVMLDLVEKPLQINVYCPVIPLGHEVPRRPHRLMGAASGSEAEALG